MIFRHAFFDFPGGLKTLWMKPLQLQGFEVIADQVETYIAPDGRGVPYCSGEVCWNEYSMGIVGQPGERVIGFLLGVNTTVNEPFLDTVTRVLFASGAKITRLSRHVHCKDLFLAPSDDLEKYLDALDLNGSFVRKEVNSLDNSKKRLKREALDFVGAVMKSGVTVHVFAGHGFNVNTSEGTSYIALDYKKRLLQTDQHLRVVVDKIKDIIVSNGMQSVETAVSMLSL